MKNILIPILFLISGNVIIAQTDLINENFDNYSPGDLVAETIGDPWTTKTDDPGSAEDAPISSIESNSGSNSMMLSGPAQTQGPDMVILKLGNKTSGNYSVSSQVNVPTGKGGLIAIHRTEVDPMDTKVMFFIGLKGDGTGVIVKNNSTIVKNFNYSLDTWLALRFEFDLENEVALVYFNEVLQYTHSEASAGQIGSVEFLSYAGSSGGPSTMFIDDVVFTNQFSNSIQEISNNDMKIYPNPVLDMLNIELNNVSENVSVSITDSYGRTLSEISHLKGNGAMLNTQVDVSHLPFGIYQVEIVDGERFGYYRFVKQ